MKAFEAVAFDALDRGGEAGDETNEPAP